MKRAFILHAACGVHFNDARGGDRRRRVGGRRRRAATPAPPATNEEQQDAARAHRTAIRRRAAAGGVALTPKSPRGDVRLIEISDTIAINGVQVSGRELRERVGADADTILRLSYLDREDSPQALCPRGAGAGGSSRRRSPRSNARRRPRRSRRRLTGRSTFQWRSRARVRRRGRERRMKRCRGRSWPSWGRSESTAKSANQVVAVLGTVDLGPQRGRARRRGHRRRTTAESPRRAGQWQRDRSVAQVMSARGSMRCRDGGRSTFGGFGPVARLIGTTFRFVLLALVACLALVVARRAVEGSAQRVADEPVRSTLVGLAAWVLFVPMFVLDRHRAGDFDHRHSAAAARCRLPCSVLLLMAVVGFSGTANAVGQWARRRFGMATTSGIADVCLGILIILLPVLLGRVVALGGWTLSPIVFLLVATGSPWSSSRGPAGFGAVLTNMFSRWQAKRATRPAPPAPFDGA